MNWDDIKIFLEVARSQRLVDASKRLSLDTSTISRRLHKLEEQLSTQLFKRTPEGHQMTPDGERLLLSARRMEQDAKVAFDDITQYSAGERGKVRIGVTEAFGNFFIAPNLVKLHQEAPNIQIDLLHFSRDVKISRNEAEIAIAVEKPKSTSMIISKLTEYRLQLYANKHSASLLGQAQDINQIHKAQWVSYVDNLLYTKELNYLHEFNDQITPLFQSTSIISQYNAIKSGLGIGILPSFLADQDSELIKLHPEKFTLTRNFWLVTHPEIKRLARVNRVWHYLKQLAQDNQALLLPDS